MVKVRCLWSIGEEVATYLSHQVDSHASPAKTIDNK